MKPTLTLFLDTRRAKSDGKFPLKIRIYFNGKANYLKTGFDLSEEEYFNGYLSQKPRKEFKELKFKLHALLNNASVMADEIMPFNIDKFERRLYGGTANSSSVNAYYNNYIESLKGEDRIATASSYGLSLKCLKEFCQKQNRIDSENIAFNDITPEFLAKYEKWMEESGRSLTTVGIYLRPLRALFNIALEEGDIKREQYPFGKRRYQIPSGRKVKKALSRSDLGTLFNYPLPEDGHQRKARDFWFFSYQCNGMNIKDILGLRYSNIQGDVIVFIRSKTKNSTKSDSKPIIVPLTSFARNIIERYGNPKSNKTDYIFPVYKEGMNEEEKHRKTNIFTKFINQHIKKVAEASGITTDISTYWARHSFTTNAIRNGASLEFIQDSLGHKDMKTTMNYWSGFEESVKRDISEKIMDFT